MQTTGSYGEIRIIAPGGGLIRTMRYDRRTDGENAFKRAVKRAERECRDWNASEQYRTKGLVTWQDQRTQPTTATGKRS